MKRRLPVVVAALPLTMASLLTGCGAFVANTPGGGDAAAPTVVVTDDACDVSTDSAPSGTVTFSVTNSGSRLNEFEILAEDQLRIVGEKENLGPGVSSELVVQLAPGTYFTACKPGMVGDPVHLAAFTVTPAGDGSAATADPFLGQAVQDAEANYLGYVRDQAGRLLTATQTFAAAFAAGDTATARDLYPRTRAFFERIEPTAESFGDLDPLLDRREADLQPGEVWSGWHLIEKDLWAPAGYTPMSAPQRAAAAADLVTNTQSLYNLVYEPSFTLSLDAIGNGAAGLLEEVARTKVTGEEEVFSHTDLWDFQANVEGARVAYGTVRDILAAKGNAGTALIARIEPSLDAITAELAGYGSIDGGFPSYDTIDDAQRRTLSNHVNALSEPLSRLTGVLVG
ncbi:iron uptake system protein EfeO [Millisia brevis]|uniref:iron uptake system protein EfeO n=1 Tax=Millisia brevis TaxID=264148 RepID=UPI00082BBCF2|nr:iron uptake system protein EfeO [Millisia brevis]